MIRYGNDIFVIKGGSKLIPILRAIGVTDDVRKAIAPPKPAKHYTKIKTVTFPKSDYNFMMDLLELPETSDGFRYLLVCVDLWSDEFDIEPLKKKDPRTVLSAFKKMLKRPYLNLPYASIATDQGNEFRGAFHDFIFNKNIYHKWAEPGRKTQMSAVESLNGTLGYLFNSYMNQMELNTGSEFVDWSDIVPIVRKDLNEMRKKPDGDPYAIRYFDPPAQEPAFDEGEIVHWALSRPATFTDRKLIGKFREGDRRWSSSAVKIKAVLFYSDKHIPYRYLLNNGQSVSYTEKQLMRANDQDEEQFFAEDIIGKRKNRGKVEYLVKWADFPRSQATWEPRQQLIDDGLQRFIQRFKKRKNG